MGEANGDLWVNLLLSGATAWATIVSCDPQEGRVDSTCGIQLGDWWCRIPSGQTPTRFAWRRAASLLALQRDWIAGIRPAASTQPSPSTQPAMQSHMVIDELRPGQEP